MSALGWKHDPDCTFPKWPIEHGETGKIALNEWPLLGAWIASLNVGMWAEADAHDDMIHSWPTSECRIA
jgi:hypothetical protein